MFNIFRQIRDALLALVVLQTQTRNNVEDLLWLILYKDEFPQDVDVEKLNERRTRRGDDPLENGVFHGKFDV